MPVKSRRLSSGVKKQPSPPAVTDKQRNSLSDMFRRIESADFSLRECSSCNLKIKSCMFNDHVQNKCGKALSQLVHVKSEEVFIIDDDSSQPDDSRTLKQVKQELEEVVQSEKRIKLESDVVTVKSEARIEDIKDTVSQAEESASNPADSEITTDFYLDNFMSALNSVLSEKTFACLLNKFDFEAVDQFSGLTSNSKRLYVRLFQRKFNWIKPDNIKYDQICTDLKPNLAELGEKKLLVDESTIGTYEELVSLFKLPELKDLAKQFHILTPSQNVKGRNDLIKQIIQHFKTQKSLKFNKQQSSENGGINKNFMDKCKRLLGKCWKLDKTKRDVFIRILTLYNLSSTYHSDSNKGNDSGQHQLMQVLMTNFGKVKFVNYEIRLDLPIFRDRDALLRYQSALEYEFDLLALVDAKEYDQAFDSFNPNIPEFKQQITNPLVVEFDQSLPIYLRKFTSNSVLCKCLSIYANEVLQKLKKYAEANDLFKFLLEEQNTYSLDSRARWFERLSLNLETHLKLPNQAFDVLERGLNDTRHVRKAGRLALYQRLVKMKQTKRYLNMKDMKEKLQREHEEIEGNEFIEAPTVEIEGTILHSEFIPGRKNVFINHQASDDEEDSQNSSDIKSKFGTLSVEQVALGHYIKKMGYTDGKHAETSTLTTLFGILFWDVIFEDKQVTNVFVDRFQSRPLDLGTDYFYLSRRDLIDSRLDHMQNSSIETICEIVTNTWMLNKDYECSLVNWSLFDSLEELLGLVKCFSNFQLASLCKYMSQNYRYCRSGGPDLIVWSTKENKCKFVEVKGPGDRLSYKQMVWLDFLIRNGIECEVCHVRGLNSKRLRD